MPQGGETSSLNKLIAPPSHCLFNGFECNAASPSIALHFQFHCVSYCISCVFHVYFMCIILLYCIVYPVDFNATHCIVYSMDLNATQPARGRHCAIWSACCPFYCIALPISLRILLYFIVFHMYFMCIISLYCI